MATRKKASRKKSSSKAVALPWKQQLAEHAKSGRAPKEKQGGGDNISTRGGRFSLGGQVIGREMDVIILNFTFQNTYYDTPYQEGEVNAPACFAIGYNEDTLAPHPTSPDRQADSCEECELNVFGSGQGDGKACTNRRALALIHESQTGEPEIKILRLAPTSLANWRKYVNDCEARGLELLQCATHIEFDPDSTAAFPPLLFHFKSEITNEETLETLVGLLPQAERMIEAPFDASNYGKPSRRGGKKKGTKKKSARSKYS